MEKKLRKESVCVQAGWTPKKGEPRVLPIYQSTTFKYDNSEQMARLFDLEDTGYFYTRLQNPTNDAVAAKIAELEGGVGAMLTSSGQAANFYAVFNICQAGDHFVTSNTIYGGTYNLFGVTMKKLGIECTFVDPEWDDERIEAAFRPNTKCFFGETISNPGGHVFDIERFARMAHKHGVPLIVDNTFATPINCRPFEWGADIVTHSTTKYMDGHATSVGGAIVDSGNFDWNAHADKFPGLCQPDESYHGLTYAKAFGKMAYITKATAQLMRDLGSIQSPQNAFLLNLGLETLHLRMPQHCRNAQAVAEYLEKNERVAWVNYCGLKSNKYYELGQKYLPNGSCGHRIRSERHERGCHTVHGQPEDDLHRDACGRCPHVRAASGQPYAPPTLRRTVARSRSGTRPHPPVGRHRKCRRHHRRHPTGIGCIEISGGRR